MGILYRIMAWTRLGPPSAIFVSSSAVMTILMAVTIGSVIESFDAVSHMRKRRRLRWKIHLVVYILTALTIHSWCTMRVTVAFVPYKPIDRRSHRLGQILGLEMIVRGDSHDSGTESNLVSGKGWEGKVGANSMGRQFESRANNSDSKIPRHKLSSKVGVIQTLDRLDSPGLIQDWFAQLKQQDRKHYTLQGDQHRQQVSDLTRVIPPPGWATWDVRDQVDFIRYLQKRNAYPCITMFLRDLGKQNGGVVARQNPHSRSRHSDQLSRRLDRSDPNLVKVYTTALFAISTSRTGSFDSESSSWKILDQMDLNRVEPTSLTLVAVFQCVRNGPTSVVDTVQRLEDRYPSVAWNAEVYHSAMYACRCRNHHPTFRDRDADYNRKSIRTKQKNYRVLDGGDYNKDWQTAVHLMQQMQRKRIKATSKTYLAVLEVLSKTGKIPMVRSLIRQWRNSGDISMAVSTSPSTALDKEYEDRIWAVAINACAEVGDYRQSVIFVQEMMAVRQGTSSSHSSPNLRHCTALLKAFAKAGEDQLAWTALSAMLGDETAFLRIPGIRQPLLLPRTDPDLVALNTIIAATTKAGNFDLAQQLFDRLKKGDFLDPTSTSMEPDSRGSTRKVLTPDRISYHSLLTGCTDPVIAKRIVKEMRLSRRNRYGAIPPSNVTYAHAIHVCQQADNPDLDSATELLAWAKDDRVTPTVYMYASAIWTSQRCGNLSCCLQLYQEMLDGDCSPNAVVLNGVLSALCDGGEIDQALQIFDQIEDSRLHVMASPLKRLVNLVQGNLNLSVRYKENVLVRILGRLDQRERKVDVGGPVFEALISLYGSMGNIDRALKVVNDIVGYMDTPCLRAILFAHATCHPVRWMEAVELLHTSDITRDSPGTGLIDQVALGHVLSACSKMDEFEEALSLLQVYGIHTSKLPHRSPALPIVALNGLIAACGRGGRPDLALALLNEMEPRFGIVPDSRSYRSAIIACNQAEHERRLYTMNDDESDDESLEPSIGWWECSLALLRRMVEEGLTPDKQAYSSVISSCEAAGEWQRALGVLQMIIEGDEGGLIGDSTRSLNLYCWNAAISACEKGGAWVEALDLYERMLQMDALKPNVVTMNSLLEALDSADQKELAQSKYDEGVQLGIVNPWRWTKNKDGGPLFALDLHRFSAAMAKAAIRNIMDSWLNENDVTGGLSADLVIITGKGINSESRPVLQNITASVLREYGIEAKLDATNHGRTVVEVGALLECFAAKSWK